MNIYRAREILPVRSDGVALNGRTHLTEAIIIWRADFNPHIVRLGDQEKAYSYAGDCLRVLDAVRNNRRYRGEHYDGDYFRFGGHVFNQEEMEALDCWIKYYAGPSLFM